MSKLEELIKEFCPNGVEYISVEELLKEKTISSITPSLKIKRNDYKDFGEIPIISQEEEYISGYCNIFDKKIIDGQYVCFGDHTENVKYVDFRFVQGADGLKIICCNNKEKIDIKYFYYAVCNFYKRHNNYERHYKYFVELKIPLPALPVQREIVRILDSFTLYSAELTAELTARRKQYEFYRDKLLQAECDVKWSTLGEICSCITSGGTPNSSRSDYYGGNIPWLRTQEVDWREINDTEIKITQSGYDNSSAKWIPVNCVIIAMYGATAAKVAINKIPLTTNQACCNLSINEKIANYKYVYYWMCKEYLNLKAMGQGSQCNINAQIIKNYKIPIPPMDVQERIVKVLDNFDTICSDLGIGLPAEIEKRQKQYEYYREKLLTFDGKYATILTERNGTERNGTERNGTERNGTERAGLIRLLQYVYGFAFVRLEDIADYSTNRITAKSVDKYNYVGVDNLLADRQGKTESVYVPENGNLIEFRSENTLIGNIRPYLKKIWFANCDGGTNGDVLVIKANEDYVMPKYLYYVLSSDKFFAFDMQYAKGAKMPRGNKEAIMTYQFSLPTLEKQKEIVNILDKFDNLCNDLSAGLPAEIEHRQKQYEYYRDKLLRF